MTQLNESTLEKTVIQFLQALGYEHLPPEKHKKERDNLAEVILSARLKTALERLNPEIPATARADAMREILNLQSQNPIIANENFQSILTDGVRLEYQKNGETAGASVRLFDFENPANNDFAVCDQFTVIGKKTKRADVVIFINGLPLVVVELKSPADARASVQKAYQQLQNYKQAIAHLFCYNGVLVASDGFAAKMGSLSAGWARFSEWKTVGGKRQNSTVPQIQTLINGMCAKNVLLDLIRHFTVFEKVKTVHPDGSTKIETVKKIAAYHQYDAVKKAVENTKIASQGGRKAGVVWHTQGSGKSLSMVFYAGLLVADAEMKNPTIVMLTDRNDLDDQLFATFANNEAILRAKPAQAKSRADLKKLLKTAGGGIIFTTIQKFSEADKADFEWLSMRENIVVVADEAHRSHYGFGAKTTLKNGAAAVRYGFAKYLRDALPNASFIGFTGTPIEKEDKSTPAVFGDYIDIYDIERAVEDGATVKIYYQSRLVKVGVKPEAWKKMDAEVERITENETLEVAEKIKLSEARQEKIIGNKKRLQAVAEDLVAHFEARQENFEGKAMVVSMSRRIAVLMYDEMIKIRPGWHDAEIQKGALKVVMTSDSSDPENWQPHHTDKRGRSLLAARFKNPDDPLRMVIVCDMWLTGFDAPCLHTMYVDKRMQSHNLMQAIARVNRIYKDKPGGLIVDYIGIASDLKRALGIYTRSGGKGAPTIDQSEAVALMMEKYETVVRLFAGFDYQTYFSANGEDKMAIILEAQNHILGLEDGKNRFAKAVASLSAAFALSVPSPEALKIKDALGFFQIIKSRLGQFSPTKNRGDSETETALRQIVDAALTTAGVVDVFDAAGIQKPNIAILSDQFLAEVRGMKHRNLALELLKKLLNDEIKTRERKNFIQSKKFSQRLGEAVFKYQNQALIMAQMIDELIDIAKEIKAFDARGKMFGLSEDEIAVYDALAENSNAQKDENLRKLACILTEKIRASVTIDWTKKESRRNKLRVIIKRFLREHGYPADKEKLVIENVLRQAELRFGDAA